MNKIQLLVAEILTTYIISNPIFKLDYLDKLLAFSTKFSIDGCNNFATIILNKLNYQQVMEKRIKKVISNLQRSLKGNWNISKQQAIPFGLPVVVRQHKIKLISPDHEPRSLYN